MRLRRLGSKTPTNELLKKLSKLSRPEATIKGFNILLTDALADANSQRSRQLQKEGGGGGRSSEVFCDL
jgi:hypothetical protein